MKKIVNFVLLLAGLALSVPTSETAVKNQQPGGNDLNVTRYGGFPAKGNNKLLMILANFSDTTPMANGSQLHFNNLMNQTGYNSTGSFKDYHSEQSGNQQIVTTTVTEWMNLPQAHDYYGPQNMWGKFVKDALAAAENSGVDFSQFDNNGDGLLDGVVIVHQGSGQEYSGNTNDIWAHSASLVNSNIIYDGIKMAGYVTMAEKSSWGNFISLSALCHEFGHMMGAPDFYGSITTSGTGVWDIMADYISEVQLPRHNPYTKCYYFNWTEPVLLTSDTLITATSNSLEVYRYDTKTPNEFFLLENRQSNPSCYSDRVLPGHGLLIYHADGDYINAHYSSHDINMLSHQGLDLEVASGTLVNSSSASWPGSENKTEFTDFTVPGAKSYANANTEKPITGISENSSNGTVSFNFKNNTAIEDQTAITDKSFELQQNYPNPFNPSTTISFVSNNTGLVTLRVFDSEGREMADLLNGELNKGIHSVQFKADNLASGIYFYQLKSGGNVAVKKMILAK